MSSVQAADRFLDCVLRRAGRDISINPLVLLLIIPGSLSFVVLLIIRLYLDFGVWFGLSDAGEYLVSLFFSMDAAFITYVLMKSVKLHTDRAIVWTDSLSEFVEDNGKDSTELRMLAYEMASLRIVWGRMISFLIFVAMVAMMALSFFILDFRSGSEGQFATPEMIVLLVAGVNLCGTSLFCHLRIFKVDAILCRFTATLSDLFDDKLMPEPLNTSIGEKNQITHIAMIVAAVVLTAVLEFSFGYLADAGFDIPNISPLLIIVGLYFTFLFFYVIITLNKHIKCLWEYENKLLVWMANHVGAKRIDRVLAEEPRAKPEKMTVSYLAKVGFDTVKKWFMQYFDLI